MNKVEEENLEELSVAGDVAGYSLPLGAKKVKKRKLKLPENYYTSRTEFFEELSLRSIIREKIVKLSESRKAKEAELRSLIREIIVETKKDLEDSPHSSTAINLLEELLKKILPNLETEYKTLTTKKSQRDSFRAHVVNAVSTLLETEGVNDEGGEAASEESLISLDEQDDEIEEEVDIKVADLDSSAEDKFIDIDPAIEPEPEPEDNFGIEGQDPTGRAFAQDAFNNIEKNIAETYAILHDEEDEKLFKDYLVTNLKLYFDKWEKELGAVAEPTTDEYEAEKDEQEVGAEFDAELGSELEDNPLE